jgi:hypothetical protein
MRILITKKDLRLSLGEKISDIITYSPLGFLLAIPFVLILLALAPFLILAELIFRNSIKNYYYKWTGKTPKTFEQNTEFDKLPIHIDIDDIYSADRLVENLKKRFDLSDLDFRDQDLVIIKSIPSLNSLENRVFERQMLVFKNIIIAEEVVLLGFTNNLCYLDCDTFEIIPIQENAKYRHISFDANDTECKIILRDFFYKKQIVLKYSR